MQSKIEVGRDYETLSYLKQSKEFTESPKILIIGKIGSGKSLFVKRFLQEDINVEIGDGEACSQKLKYYPGTLQGSDEYVHIIDTPGIDFGPEKDK